MLFYFCVVFDCIRVVCYFLEYGVDVDVRDNEGSIFFYFVVVFCDFLGLVDEEYDMIFLLFKYGVNVNLRDFEGSIFLYIVVVFGEIRFVCKLIFVGSDVNLFDVRGDILLIVFVGLGYLDVVWLLVDNEVDLFVVNK